MRNSGYTDPATGEYLSWAGVDISPECIDRIGPELPEVDEDGNLLLGAGKDKSELPPVGGVLGNVVQIDEYRFRRGTTPPTAS